VIHKRSVTFTARTAEFAIEDSFSGEGLHRYDVLWQVPPKATVTISDQGMVIQNGGAIAKFAFESATPIGITSVSGSREPFAGWYSEGYGKLEASTTIKVTLQGSGAKLVSRIHVNTASKAGDWNQGHE
jgi:hypothetical protein